VWPGSTERERERLSPRGEKMIKEVEQVGKEVDSWILEEDLPGPAFLKPINKKDELYTEIGIETDEEREAYWDFIYQCINMENKIILDLPMPEDTEFWPPIETDESLSFAFSSMDYQRRNQFNKYHWKLKKIYEKIKDLAITYSCISDEQGKKNIHQRFKNVVEKEFRDRAVMLIETYKKHSVWVNKHKLFNEIEELNSKIKKCKKIWNQYSNWE